MFDIFARMSGFGSTSTKPKPYQDNEGAEIHRQV